jgi:integrase
MQGHLRKRGDKWCFVIDIGKDPETGKRKQKWVHGFATKRQAQQGLQESLGQLNRGAFVEPSKLTLGEYLLTTWLPAIQDRVRTSTFDSYSRNIRLHVNPHVGGVALQAVSGARLTSLYGNLRRPEGPTKPLSAKTVRYIHLTLHKALADAENWNLIPKNPASAAAAPSIPPRAGGMRIWTAAEVRAFLAAVADEPLKPAWYLAALTGMRRGEVLGVRWCDLDLQQATLSVRQTLISVGYMLQFSAPKTSNGARLIALDQTTVSVLREHREQATRLGQEASAESLVFLTPELRPVHPDGFSQRFERLIKNAGLRTIRLHDLRHTHASLALAAGVHPKVVSERLGHSTVALTLDVYSHAVPALQSDAASLLERIVQEASCGPDPV